MVVGSRLTVRATPDFEKLGITDKEQQKKIKKALEREFRDWAYDSRLLQDAEGHYDFGGMAWLMFRNLTGPDGECAALGKAADADDLLLFGAEPERSAEHTSELQSLMRISYADFGLQKKTYTHHVPIT